MKQLSLWMSASLVVGAFGVLLWLEHRRPLRRSVESKLTRTARNVAVVAVGAMALQVTERPIIALLTAWVEQGHWGLLKWINLPM